MERKGNVSRLKLPHSVCFQLAVCGLQEEVEEAQNGASLALSKTFQSHVPQTHSLRGVMQNTLTAETNVEQGMRTSVLGLSSGFGSKHSSSYFLLI